MESIEVLEKKLAKCRNNENEKIKILNNLSKACWSSFPNKALDYGKQALILSEKIDDKEEKGNALNYIGGSYIYLAKYDFALEFFFKALEIFEELGLERKIAYSYNNIGLIYNNIGNYSKSLEFHQKSAEINKILGYKKGYANSLNNMGNTYNYRSQYDKALECQKKALKVYEEIDEKSGISASLNNIGAICMKNKHDYNKSLEYFLKSLSINEDIQDKNRITISLINIGECYIETKQPEKALFYLEKGIKTAQEIKSKDLTGACYKAFSKLYSNSNNYKKSLEYYKLFSENKDSIFTEESSKKIAEMQTKYETERKEKEAEIYRLKNIELVNVNKDIQNKNKKLKLHRKHINLINKILEHDLANNLDRIKSAVFLFENSKDEHCLNEIDKSVQISVELIHNMRNLEQFLKTHRELKIYDVNRILQKIAKNYSSIEINIKGKGNVVANETLESIFENIIRDEIIYGKADKINITITKHKINCLIKIADNGNSIPDEIKDKIFEENFIYGKDGHTGLGLYIVKKAMEIYDGEIFIENNKPKGVVFTLIFLQAG
ncbi:MAG: tetratricopeptide repeat-containing sensor histidine kinase [Candidatus Cloacimonetes bacterium]|nr:tetratricopeptide repeat-containing sensor histidine kinase [Candidatus Cloacimonadota bacterium]